MFLSFFSNNWNLELFEYSNSRSTEIIAEWLRFFLFLTINFKFKLYIYKRILLGALYVSPKMNFVMYESKLVELQYRYQTLKKTHTHKEEPFFKPRKWTKILGFLLEANFMYTSSSWSTLFSILVRWYTLANNPPGAIS